MGRPRTAHPSQPIARPPVPGSSGWGHTGVAQAAECPRPSTSSGSWGKSCAAISLPEQPVGSLPCSLLGLAGQALGFSGCIEGKKKRALFWVCGSSGRDGAGWARAILQQHPQPSCPQGHIIVAAPVLLWIDATKVISVTMDVCQREGAAAGTGCLTPLPSQCPCSLPPVLEPGEVCAAADAHGQKQHCGLGSPRSH